MVVKLYQRPDAYSSFNQSIFALSNASSWHSDNRHTHNRGALIPPVHSLLCPRFARHNHQPMKPFYTELTYHGCSAPRITMRLCSTRCEHFNGYTDGSSVLKDWEYIVSSASGGASAVVEDAMKRIVQDAIRVYTKQASGAVMPERATDIFLQAYKRAVTGDAKLPFFRMLCQEFGVQGKFIWRL